MTNYQRGAAFERVVVASLSDVGYVAARFAGSKSAMGADVIAMGHRQILLVQCKTGAKSISAGEWNSFYNIVTNVMWKEYGLPVYPIVAQQGDVVKGRRTPDVFYLLTGERIPSMRRENWPCARHIINDLIGMKNINDGS